MTALNRSGQELQSLRNAVDKVNISFIENTKDIQKFTISRKEKENISFFFRKEKSLQTKLRIYKKRKKNCYNSIEIKVR